MIIPTGNDKEDLKMREAVITSFYVEWNRNNPERRVFNDNLNDYIYVAYLSLDETRRHAAKRYQSTLPTGRNRPVKLLVGIKKKTGEIVQYCITSIEPQQ